uniref:Uncharacterized protein n=1 Tax=Panagrolaimus davidi TaxID=227884 RepID=A0A914PHZ1_9BILA
MIVLGLVNSFENDEKILYLNLMAELLLIPTVINKEETLRVRRKRPYRDIIKKNDVERTSNISVNERSSLSITTTIPTNSLNPVTFDIVKYRENGTFNKRLLLFTSNERKQCYEYYSLHSRSSYRCIECKKERNFVDIKYSVNDEGRKTFHFNTPQHHICEPFDYSPTNYGPSLIVKSPNFMLTEHKYNGRFFPKVIILDENDKNFKAELQYSKPMKVYYCFRCRKQKTNFTARIIDFEGNDAIEIGCSKHVCMNKI